MIKNVFLKNIKNISVKKNIFKKTTLFFSAKKINRFFLENDKKLLDKKNFFLKKTNNKSSKNFENNYNLIAISKKNKKSDINEIKNLFSLPLTALFLVSIKVNNTFFTRTRSFFQEKNFYMLKNNYKKIAVVEQPFVQTTLWSFRIPNNIEYQK